MVTHIVMFQISFINISWYFEKVNLVLRFIGNKSNLLDFIDKSLIDANQNINIVADVFSGTTSVAKHFKRKDILHFSYVLQRAYIQLNDKEALKSNKKISELINDLNNLEIKKGFFLWAICS